MNRKQIQTYEPLAQCLIKRDPLKGYSISRWFKPYTGYEISTDSNTTEEAALQSLSQRKSKANPGTTYIRVAQTRFEIKNAAPNDADSEPSQDTVPESSDTAVPSTDSTTDFVSPISNTMAMQILDDLPLIGSPVPDHPLSFILDFTRDRKHYLVHVSVSRKTDREVMVWQEWYAKRRAVSFWKLSTVGLLACIMGFAACFFTFAVPYYSLKKNNETKDRSELVQTPTVRQEASMIPNNNVELEQWRQERKTMQTQLSLMTEAVRSFRSFPTTRMYKPQTSILDSSCTFEEKLHEFFSQNALTEPLVRSEVVPWIMIEWRGMGSIPDIDRIFLTNQDGKSLRDFLFKLRKANLLDNKPPVKSKP